MKHRCVYLASVITGGVCGFLGAFTAFAVVYNATIRTGNYENATVWPEAMMLALAGMLIGLVVAWIVGYLGKTCA